MEPVIVHFEGEAVIHLPDDGDAEVTIELVGGRDRHSVGGQIAGGPRWWGGRVVWARRSPTKRVAMGSEIHLELADGRTAAAGVEAGDVPSDGEDGAAIRGLGPPPFTVP